MSIDCACDYDPPEFYRKRSPKARKEHRCEECNRPIKPGDRYEYVTAKWEGYLSSFRTCQRCVDLRQWVKNNVPCFCWTHGGLLEDAEEAVSEACYRAPEETVGLRFGLLRRLHEPVLLPSFSVLR